MWKSLWNAFIKNPPRKRGMIAAGIFFGIILIGKFISDAGWGGGWLVLLLIVCLFMFILRKKKPAVTSVTLRFQLTRKPVAWHQQMQMFEATQNGVRQIDISDQIDVTLCPGQAILFTRIRDNQRMSRYWLLLYHPSVIHRNCKVGIKPNGDVYLENMGPIGGTRVNGRQLNDDQTVTLRGTSNRIALGAGFVVTVSKTSVTRPVPARR